MGTPDADVLSLRRRAELRGLEAVALSRVSIGVWTARLLGTLGILNGVLAAAITGSPAVGAGWALWGVGLHISASRMSRGSRLDAWVLLGLSLLGHVAYFAAGRGDLVSLAIAVATLSGLGIGLAGQLALARIRDQERSAERSHAAA